MRKLNLKFGSSRFSIALAGAISIFFLTFASGQAKADILLEPYAGFSYSPFTTNLTGGGTVSDSLIGPNIGGRLGYSWEVFFLALDYDYGMLNSTVTAQPSGDGYAGSSVTTSTLYALLGLKIPLLQAYAGYAPLNNWDFKASGMGSVDVTFVGSAVKLGVGFTGLPLIALNLEYIMSTFSSYTDTSNHSMGSTGSTFGSASASTLMVTVSVPFRI